MTISELRALAESSNWLDEDGYPYEFKFFPGSSEAEISMSERKLGLNFPDDYRETALLFSRIDGFDVELSFAVEDRVGSPDEIIPNGMIIGRDGYGNDWFVDVVGQSESEAEIFFACHDPAMLLYQGRGMAMFFDELAKMTAGEPSLIDDVHDDRLYSVVKTHPGEIGYQEALGADPLVREFAQALGPDFFIVDLRNVRPGMGIDLDRFGGKTKFRRNGEHRIFAYAPPEKRSGFLLKILGRG